HPLVGFGLAELKSFHKIRHNICDIGRLIFQGFSSKRQPSHPIQLNLPKVNQVENAQGGEEII
ncbi:hypothetical protein SAMN04487985_1321, partial [Aerococcus urinaehominis]